MSTNSSIGIERDDGSIEAIFCKWDGYRDHNGKLLLEHFAGRVAVEALVESGTVGLLCEYLRRTRDLEFRCALDCPPFPKAGGGKHRRPIKFIHRQHFEAAGEEYVYLFGRDGKWWGWAWYGGSSRS